MKTKNETKIPAKNQRTRSFSPHTGWRAPEPLKRISGPPLRKPITNSQNHENQVLAELENEYIKSLQQQVYLLELENSYIRQQAANAIEMQPAMISEASNALSKITDLESKNNAMELEVYRKEAHVSILQEKYNTLEKKLKNTLLSHDKLADDLKRQLITIRGEREIAVREGMEKDAQIADLKDDLNRHKSSLAAADNQLDLLRAKLENEMLRTSELEKALVEKRAEMVQMNATLRQLELQYRDEVTRVNSAPNPEAQEKMQRLQQQLTDSFLNSENDRFVREKQAQEIALLTQENAKLSRENVALRSEAETARSTLNHAEGRHAKELAELNSLRQREKDLLQSNISLRQDLEIQDKRCKHLEKQLEKQERIYDDTVRNPLKQRSPTVSADALQMQQDKQMLLDHISEMQREIARQGQALDALKRSQSFCSPPVTGQLQTNTSSVRSTTPLLRSQNAPYPEQMPVSTSDQQPVRE